MKLKGYGWAMIKVSHPSGGWAAPAFKLSHSRDCEKFISSMRQKYGSALRYGKIYDYDPRQHIILRQVAYFDRYKTEYS